MQHRAPDITDSGKVMGLSLKRIVFFALAALMGVIVLAWIDGGEETIHPITQTISAPASFEGRN
ncbi:MAG: hypothetical protein SXU28_12510 [Pseudomonadota bacterium]|nr:hypothetical protein [Pseudomonadota bacterium]